MLIAFFALLQAVAPPEPAAEVQPVAETTQVAEAAAPEEPKMKRVCRKVIDPRVGTLASRQTVCKFVPADGKKN